ncbi:GatB/YqeY domain-containing protein [Patescibacteria group bacterium]
MSALAKIQQDLKTSLKEKDVVVSSTLRLLLSAIKNLEINLNKRDKLSEEEIGQVVKKQARQRQESIDAYQKAKRIDLADKESQELKVLSKYLPQEINPSKLQKIVKEAIETTGAKGPSDFGAVMKMVMAQAKGQADGKQVAEMVKKSLTG